MIQKRLETVTVLVVKAILVLVVVVEVVAVAMVVLVRREGVMLVVVYCIPVNGMVGNTSAKHQFATSMCST